MFSCLIFSFSMVLFLSACTEKTVSADDDNNPGENGTTFGGDSMNPAAHDLRSGDFIFDFWADDEPDDFFPANMIFQQSDMDDPMLDDEMTEPYNIPHDDYNSDDEDTIGYPYNNTRRTRINGLNEQGIAFINTGRGRDLGTAVVGLQTLGMHDITVQFLAGTRIPNSRVYNLRLQYRIGTSGSFTDVIHNGEAVEYRRNDQENHTEQFGPIPLPEAVNDREYVQIRWKYYFTGERISDDSGARTKIRLDNIRISGTEI